MILRNGFVTSAVGSAPLVVWGQRSWTVALLGAPNVGIIFMEDTAAGLGDPKRLAGGLLRTSTPPTLDALHLLLLLCASV